MFKKNVNGVGISIRISIIEKQSTQAFLQDFQVKTPFNSEERKDSNFSISV